MGLSAPSASLVSLALVLVGDFNFPDICWKYNKAEREQSQRLLECVGENFLTQLVRELTREGALLDLLFVNRGQVDDVEVGGRLGHSDHEIIEFSILREARRGGSRTDILDFQRLTLTCLGTCLTESGRASIHC